MAALSAISAYDVSDAESDEHLEGSDEAIAIIVQNSKPIEQNVNEKPTINDDEDIFEMEEGSNTEESPDPEAKIDSEYENEEETEDRKAEEQPAKLISKRYSCDSATAFALKLRSISEEEGLQLPSEPDGVCDPDLQKKIARFYEKKIKEGENLNQRIQERKDFRNPSIYEKLILFLGIEERGTNLPKKEYNPYAWNKVPSYEALARIQREDVSKKEKKTKVEFVTGTAKKSGGATSTTNESVKKTKWDIKHTDDKNTFKTIIISAVGNIKRPKP